MGRSRRFIAWKEIETFDKCRIALEINIVDIRRAN